MRLPQRLIDSEGLKKSFAEQVILGSTIGDGRLVKRNKKGGTALLMGHCKKQKEYLEWKVDILKKAGFEFVNQEYENLYAGKYIMYQVGTRKYIELNDYYRMFYRGRTKVIRRNVLNLFEPLALAIWYQDDGSLFSDSFNSPRVNLATCCFTEKEHKMMCKYFATRWHMTVKPRITGKNYLTLHFGIEASKKFLDIVKPFIHSVMLYKITLVEKMSIEERNLKFMESGKEYQFEKGQKQLNTGRTWFKKDHPYYSQNLNGN